MEKETLLILVAAYRKDNQILPYRQVSYEDLAIWLHEKADEIQSTNK